MDKKAIIWLYEQLPELVDKGVLTPEAAERIKEYYGASSSGLGRGVLLRVFAVLGSVLLGLGIILILGHNWDTFDHLTRLLISVGLLLAAQTAAAFALWRKSDSTAWREGTAAFLTLSLGASIALVGQTYHLVDDFKNFVLIWMLLSLPLVYIMHANSVVCMYLVGVMTWLASVQYAGMIKYVAWLLWALVLPYYRCLLKKDSSANASVLLSWLLLVCFYACFGMTWDKKLGEVLYTLLFTCTYFVGTLIFDGSGKLWQKPFQTFGMLAGIGIAYLLSFQTIWSDAWRHRSLDAVSSGEYLILVGLLILAVGLYALLQKRKLPFSPWIGVLPVVVIGGELLQFADKGGLYAAMVMNGYLLGLSVSLVWKGIKETRVSIVNVGMLMLAALILFRFFDYSYSFVVRGAVFILLGLAFLLVNLVMSRRKDGVIK